MITSMHLVEDVFFLMQLGGLAGASKNNKKIYIGVTQVKPNFNVE